MNYRHMQIGWLVLALSLVLLPIVMISAEGWRSMPLPFALAGVIAVLFGTLTVSIDDERIRWHFGVGLIRKSLPVARITSFRAVHTPWYYGWGIRFTPRGWLYNVSGSSAIELGLDNGRHVLIGTDEPDALENALRQVVVPSAHRDPVLGKPPRRWTVVLVILAVNAVVIPAILWSGSRPPAIAFSPTGLSVGGLYSADVPFSTIQEISLQDTIPRVLRKRNGFNAGNTLRGNFTLDVLGDGKIFINRGVSPYVVIKTADSYVIVNFKDPRQTRAFYEELRRHVR